MSSRDRLSEKGMALLGLLIVLVIAYFLYTHFYVKKPGAGPRGRDTSYPKKFIDEAHAVKNKATAHKQQLDQTEKDLGLK